MKRTSYFHASLHIIGVLIFGALLLVACDSNRIYESNNTFKERIWEDNDIQQFQFQIDDATINYNVFLNIRNSLLYPYQNLYTTVVIEDSLGNELFRELKNNALFDEISGEPKGKGLGDIFDHQVLISSNFQFPNKGTYQVFVTQSMRMKELPEIMAIGIRIEESDKPAN